MASEIRLLLPREVNEGWLADLLLERLASLLSNDVLLVRALQGVAAGTNRGGSAARGVFTGAVTTSPDHNLKIDESAPLRVGLLYLQPALFP